MIIAGNIIIAIGCVFILFGIIGFLKYRYFFTRILVTAKIDTVGAITIIIGVAVKHGFSFFTLRVLLLMVLMLLINPLASHMIARAAFLSGFRTMEKEKGAVERRKGEEKL